MCIWGDHNKCKLNYAPHGISEGEEAQHNSIAQAGPHCCWLHHDTVGTRGMAALFFSSFGGAGVGRVGGGGPLLLLPGGPAEKGQEILAELTHVWHLVHLPLACFEQKEDEELRANCKWWPRKHRCHNAVLVCFCPACYWPAQSKSGSVW